LASLLNYKQQVAYALRLVEQREALVHEDPELLALLIELLISNDRSEEVFRRLQTMLEASERLPDEVVAPFVELSLAHRKRDLAVRIAMHNPLDALPPWLQVTLAEVTIAAGDRGFSRFLAANLDSTFHERNPVVAAGLYFVAGDTAGLKHWIGVAGDADFLPLERRIDLVNLLMKLNRRSDALAQLVRMDPDTRGDPVILADLARLYVDLGEASRGLPFFIRARAHRRSPKNNESWALVSASAGVVEPVSAWLSDRRTHTLSTPILTDLYFIGESRGEWELALLSAERLHHRLRGRQQKLYLGRALASMGEPVSALEHLRSLLPGSVDEEQAYLDALNLAARSDAAATEELRLHLLAKLETAAPNDSIRQEIVYNLISIGDHVSVLPVTADLARTKGGNWFHLHLETARKAGRTRDLIHFLESELDRNDLPPSAREERLDALLALDSVESALPYLREFAEDYGGSWWPYYEEALGKLGRRPELMTAWKRRLRDPEITTSAKRDIAYRALDEGGSGLAESIFWEISKSAPPDSPDVSQLLYLWGPRPKPAALDWLEERANSSTGTECSQWLQHLLNGGAADRAVRTARRHLPAPGSGDPILNIYMEALSQVGDLAELENVLEREIPIVQEKENLRRLGKLAMGANHTKSARNAYEKILSISERDLEALQKLGALAFFDARYSQAKEYLSRYFSASPGDCESHYYYGEILRREKQTDSAELHYFKALELIDRETNSTLQHRILRAKLLMHTGSIADSLSAFDLLLAERPRDDNLRADLVDLLMDRGLYDEAEKYLEPVTRIG
jgi:tetratricopeptide (TPR) repeat protein